MLGIIGAIALVFLPGAWITFGLRLSDLAFWARLLIGAVLAPLVVCLQFYILRLLGVPFELTVILLSFINLPALYLILKQVRHLSLPSGRTIAGWVLVLLIPFAFFAWALVDTQYLLFGGHGWLYSDPIYMVANGSLVLEEPHLAGLRFGYPWFGLVYQGILSFLIDSPPAISFIWTNLVWLLIIFGFMAGIVGELGGNRFSRITSVIWLAFGVNFVGFVVSEIGLAVFGYYPYYIGDLRYTPWLMKFLWFEQEPMALGIFIALAYLLVRQSRSSLNRNILILIGILVCGMGILYPPLFPAAAALVGAKVIALFLNRRWTSQSMFWRQILGLGIGLLLAGIVTLIYVRYLNQDRVTGAILLSWRRLLFDKSVASVVVTLPLSIGLILALRRYWMERRSAIIVLVLGALASLFLYVVFYLPGFHNEYKFMFTAIICLAPFPSLALEPSMDKLGKWAIPAFGIIALILAIPFAFNMARGWPFFADTSETPTVDVTSFELRLLDEPSYSGLTDAIRKKTPPNSILVLQNGEIHFPSFTGMALYVQPQHEKPYPGINIIIDDILRYSRGYDMQIVEDRRFVVDELFHSHDEDRIAKSLDRILRFERPVAIVIEEVQDSALLEWLVGEGKGTSLYEGDNLVLWVVEPGKD